MSRLVKPLWNMPRHKGTFDVFMTTNSNQLVADFEKDDLGLRAMSGSNLNFSKGGSFPPSV